MKNKLKILLTAVLCAVMCLSALSFFTACGEGGGEDEKSPIVYSNGGTVVRCGNDVYYVNGIPDYTDENGKSNLTGSVVKGGLYKTTVTEYRKSLAEAERAEAEKEAEKTGGEAVVDKKADGLADVLDFAAYDKFDYIELGQYTIGSETEAARVTDENGRVHQNFISTNGERSEYRIASEQVISKKIGTSGYADGGFWIFDGIVYFATPDTDRNAEGEVQYNRAEFYSYDLQTKSMNLLYTAKEVNAAMPYAFFKRDDTVYLTTFEKYYADADDENNNILTGFIVSTAVKDGRPVETKEIARGVSSVYFPRIETYDPDRPVNTIKDYIYYTRAATTSDQPSTGSRLEMVRPDGFVPEVKDAEGKVVVAAGSGSKTIWTNTIGDLAIEGVAGDYLYFRNPTSSGITRLECTNLQVFLQEYDADAHVNEMPEDADVVLADVSEYTTIMPIESYRPAPDVAVMPCVLAVSSTGVYSVTPTAALQVYNGSVTLLGYNDGRAYGSIDTSTPEDENGENAEGGYTTFVSFSAFQHYSERTLKLLDGKIPATTFDIDFFSVGYKTTIDGKEIETEEFYTFYFSNYTETATNYAYINKVSGVYDAEGSMSVKLGQLADYDRPKIVCYDDECINWTHDHSSWDDLTPDEEEEGGQTMA